MNYIYQLQKSDLKILRYLYHHKAASLASLRRKFARHRQNLDNLIGREYIITDHILPKDSYGFPIG